ncbi:MAG TPA: hypothetical protein RMH99_01080 [Sandaracinaceae bacterium LLY-WYZ-13_1]|nr:hypothetical protein [Sandaracinaceae bacterium LLY-WYZ-13_1]
MPRSIRRWILGPLGVAALVATWAGAARAQDRVEVAAEGEEAEALASSLVSALERTHEVTRVAAEAPVASRAVRVTARGRRGGRRLVVALRVETGDGTRREARVRIRRAAQLGRRVRTSLGRLVRRVWDASDPPSSAGAAEAVSGPAEAVEENAPAGEASDGAPPDARARDGGSGRAAPARSSAGPDASARAGSAGAEPADAARRPSAFEFVAAGGVLHRRLRFDEDPVLRGYRLPAAPTLAARLRVYPLAAFGTGWWAHLGLDARAGHALGVETGDAAHPTLSYAWQAGLRVRIPFDEHEVSVGFAVGEATFVVDPAGPQRPGQASPSLLPPSRYRYLRPDVAARVALPAGFFVEAEVAWRAVYGVGLLAARFGETFATGGDASLRLGLRVTGWLAVALRGRWAGVFAWFHDAAETGRASAAADHFVTSSLEVELRDPGR